jgi:hypothetical protein
MPREYLYYSNQTAAKGEFFSSVCQLVNPNFPVNRECIPVIQEPSIEATIKLMIAMISPNMKMV